MKVLLKKICFFLAMKPKYTSKRKTRIDLGRSYGVTKFEYAELDDVDLMCEIGFLIQSD